MSIKSGAAGFMAARRRIVSAEYTTPSGLEYLGTFHIPFTSGSRISSSTASMSGPAAVMGTLIISTPKLSVTLKCRS